MSQKITKEDVILHKKQAIKKVNNLLEMYINSTDGKYLKKANLISYWLENFSDYIKNEERFDPQRLISYKRGDVIKLNFGFNVGSEHGGLHYAIVLDNDNLHSSPVVTVIPLSSGSAESTYRRDVFLGNELYTKLNSKNKLLLDNACKKQQELQKMTSTLSSILLESKESDTTISTIEDVRTFIINMQNQLKSVEADIEVLNKYEKEISHMKLGSVAKMEQITTVSKMRIYIPRKSTDTLYGISFSATAMEKINTQLLNLYLHHQ